MGYSMYICPECQKVFKVQGNNKIIKCSNCSVVLKDTNVSMEEWAALSPATKAHIKQSVISESKDFNTPIEVYEETQTQSASKKSSFFAGMPEPNNTPNSDLNKMGHNNPPQHSQGRSGVKQIKCEMCGSGELVKDGGVFVCQFCGCKYTTEEARRLMIEGTVDVRGTVKIDSSDYIQKCLMNARRALNKDDWEEVEKYYNLVEQNKPDNMEAVFFSSYGKAMLSLTDQDYFKRQQKFQVLVKSISIINDCFETTDEDKKDVLYSISDAIIKMYNTTFVFNRGVASYQVGGRGWCVNLLDSVRMAFLKELRQIKAVHADLPFIQDLINKTLKRPSNGCFVATAVYGSYDCPEVWTLRRYRDYKLTKTWYGRAFIKTYYAISPTLVDWFGQTEWFKKIWKGILDRMVKNLQNNGYESSPYKDRVW